MMMFIALMRRSPRAHAPNTRTSTTDTRRPYTRTHIRDPGAPLVQPSKGSISGEKGWGAVWATAKARRTRLPRYRQGKTFPATSCPHPSTPSSACARPPQKANIQKNVASWVKFRKKCIRNSGHRPKREKINFRQYFLVLGTSASRPLVWRRVCRKLSIFALIDFFRLASACAVHKLCTYD